jgi:hypothetical protein
MALIQRRVAPTPLPGVRVTATETPESEGAGVSIARARKDQTISGVFAQGAQDATQMIRAEQDNANETALLKASNQLAAWKNTTLYDPQTGALTKKGEDAMPLPEQVSDSFNKQADTIAAGLGNNTQKAAFARMRAQEFQSVDLEVRRHVFGEMQEFKATELKSAIDNGTNEAIRNANDPTLVGNSLAKVESQMRTNLPKLGVGPQQLDEQVRDVRSGVHVGVINQLLSQGDDVKAGQYFDEVKDQINGDALDGVTKAVDEGSLRGNAQRATDAIMSGTPGLRADGSQKGAGFLGNMANTGNPGSYSSELSIGVEINGKETEIPSLVPTLTADEVKSVLALKDGQPMPAAVVDKARAYAEKRIAAGKSPFAGANETGKAPVGVQNVQAEKPQPPETLDDAMEFVRQIQDPKLRDEVQQRVEHQFTLKDRADAEAEKQSMIAGYNIIDKTGTVARIPTSTWASYAGSTRASMIAYARMKAEGTPVKTDQPTFYALMTQAGDDPQTFATANLLTSRAKLSDSDFQQLAGLQLSIKNGERNGQNAQDLAAFSTKANLIDNTLAPLGFPEPAKRTKDQAQAVAELYRMVDRSLDAVQAPDPKTGKARKATPAEVQQAIDFAVGQSENVPGSWRAIYNPFRYDFANATKRLIDTSIDDIPPGERQDLTRALHDSHQPVTDQTVIDLYVRLHTK